MKRATNAYSTRPPAAFALAIALATGGPVARAGTPVPMATHHAVYKLSLLKAKGTNAPATATGLIEYNFSGSACDGYTTTFRQVTELQPAEGDARVNDMRSTTFEDGAGTQYSFKTTTRNDNEVVSDLDGRARKSADGRTNVDLRKPAGKATLADEVLFPTEHLQHVIATAESGGRLLEADLYDGSETGKNVFHTLSVIGKPIEAPSQDAAGDVDSLKAMRRWPVTISYFGAGKEDAPDYVLSFDLYENGISRALRLDYGDFVLAGDLTDLKVKPSAPCR